MSEKPTVPPAQGEEAEALFCPACGYDVRHTTEPRCPECGEGFDRATLSVSKIPWEYRRARGRVKTFVATTWMALAKPGTLAREASRAVDWRSASRFRWAWVGTIAVVYGAAAGFFLRNNTHGFVGWGPSFSGGPEMHPLLLPLVVLGAGPAQVLEAVIFGAAGSAGASWFMRAYVWVAGGERRDRKSAIACYGMFWLMFVGVAGCASALAGWYLYFEATRPIFMAPVHAPTSVIITVGAASLVVGGAGLVFWLWRVTRCSLAQVAAALVSLPLGATVAFLLTGGLAVYAAGMVAIMVRSLG